jgi:hypothetical protein
MASSEQLTPIFAAMAHPAVMEEPLETASD